MQESLFIALKKAEHWESAKSALRKLSDVEGHKRTSNERSVRESSEWETLTAKIKAFIEDIEDNGHQE